mmetsp:Transcript_69143/g.150441  ORF Transcript_69143/g.150441 Transcript_69143/m.150441 type:complete len:221 (-) Transcript_69143:1270-1932(-)
MRIFVSTLLALPGGQFVGVASGHLLPVTHVTLQSKLYGSLVRKLGAGHNDVAPNGSDACSQHRRLVEELIPSFPETVHAGPLRHLFFRRPEDGAKVVNGCRLLLHSIREIRGHLLGTFRAVDFVLLLPAGFNVPFPDIQASKELIDGILAVPRDAFSWILQVFGCQEVLSRRQVSIVPQVALKHDLAVTPDVVPGEHQSQLQFLDRDPHLIDGPFGSLAE